MRKPRLLIPDSFSCGVYHVVSRATNREFIFGDDEKEHLVRLMKRYATFSGIRVLTFCIMGNHFHWLVEVPKRPADADSMSDAELVARVRKCQGKDPATRLDIQLETLLHEGKTLLHAQLRQRWIARMWNLSSFVQSVKQRFSVWYNRRNKRKGTLWEERFKSTLALGPQAVATMAAYIDLNPVRAGLVEDPKDYRWSGYGEASAGVKASKAGLVYALTSQPGSMVPSRGVDALAWYRSWIYVQGAERGVAASGEPMKKGFKHEAVKAVLATKGELPAVEQLKQRVRYFSDGLVVGGKAALKAVFEQRRGYFSKRRRSGPRKMRQGGDWGELRAMRDLQS